MQTSKNSYKHLSGKWFQYHLSTDPSVQDGPFWVKHEEEFKILDKLRIEGTSHNMGHPKTPLEYTISGYIRAGKMVLTYECKQDVTEFVIIIYSNLLSRSELLGIWNGFDFRKRPTSGPIILSRNEINEQSLDNIILKNRLNFIPRRGMDPEAIYEEEINP